MMKNSMYCLVKPFLLIALSFLVTTACYSPVIQKYNIPITSSPGCRIVQHRLGETCIPVKPKRIIALDPRYLVDPVLALGIQPIGMATSIVRGKESLDGLTPDDTKSILNVGDAFNPSLEKILKLKPDLILAMDFAHKNIYKKLSEIAPTVLVNYEENTSFKKNLLYLAQLLDKEVEANELLLQYQTRIKKLRKQLSCKPQEIEVTVLIYYQGTFVITKSAHTSHEIFSDIGLTNKINLNSNEVISVEILNQYDADILFIMDYDGKSKPLFLKNPLIASLNAVKNNRAYFVDAIKWSANGPLGVNRMLDDIFKYLPQKSYAAPQTNSG
ncbi:iron-siderophore ABC transporter substrate-binding protein [Chroococcidiopsis cubana CCALA 043]|nr:iron-siderophore ABC transporter substrate-binding protein [Chroococcidiopsis cubana CCALA 043]